MYLQGTLMYHLGCVTAGPVFISSFVWA